MTFSRVNVFIKQQLALLCVVTLHVVCACRYKHLPSSNHDTWTSKFTKEQGNPKTYWSRLRTGLPIAILKPCQEYKETACQVAQRVRVFAAQPENPSSVPVPHMVEGEKQFLQAILWPPQTCMPWHTWTNTHAPRDTHKINVEKVFFFIKYTSPAEHVTPVLNPVVVMVSPVCHLISWHVTRNHQSVDSQLSPGLQPVESLDLAHSNWLLPLHLSIHVLTYSFTSSECPWLCYLGLGLGASGTKPLASFLPIQTDA